MKQKRAESQEQDSQESRAKIPFWPSRYQIIGACGCLLGTIVGPGIVVLGFLFLEWLQPNSSEGSLFSIMLALLLAVPLGAAAGTAIGMAIAEKPTLSKSPNSR
jgi:hypothetical protein